jgi:hypothetical protein
MRDLKNFEVEGAHTSKIPLPKRLWQAAFLLDLFIELSASQIFRTLADVYAFLLTSISVVIIIYLIEHRFMAWFEWFE